MRHDESETVSDHRRAGRVFKAAGVESFVREAGDGAPVLCMHGVPASCFLYRKVIAELASRGLRGVAFDLPGLGLAERPAAYDYSWSGLGRFSLAAVAALELDRFHLVVHDIGGPVGFELAALAPDRIAVDTFRRPWSMEPFAKRGIGELYLRTLSKPAFSAIMRLQGIADMRAVTREELGAYVELLKRGDGGAAFLRIMRGFELTSEKRRLYERVLGNPAYPRQVVWGAEDPALKLAVHGEIARSAAGVERIHTVPAKHFLQEDQAPAVAEYVAQLARG